jgi:hypothetical protein
MTNRKDKNSQEFIRNISHYDDRERRSGKKRRSQQVEDSSVIPSDLTPLIKQFITESLENQKRLVEVRQKKADAETRKSEAIESLLSFVIRYIEGNTNKDSLTKSKNSRKPYKKRPPDKRRIEVFKIIAKMREKNEKYADIADHLEKEGIPTFSGRGEWHAQTIHRLCRDKAYKIFIST